MPGAALRGASDVLRGTVGASAQIFRGHVQMLQFRSVVGRGELYSMDIPGVGKALHSILSASPRRAGSFDGKVGEATYFDGTDKHKQQQGRQERHLQHALACLMGQATLELSRTDD